MVPGGWRADRSSPGACWAFQCRAENDVLERHHRFAIDVCIWSRASLPAPLGRCEWDAIDWHYPRHHRHSFHRGILAHIYIGTIGMQGAFEAMGSGTVDVGWARQHHDQWAEEMIGPRDLRTRPLRERDIG